MPFLMVLKKFLTTCWESIKKVPHWALIALLMCGSVIISLMRTSSGRKKKLEVQKKISEIEKERAENINKANEINREEEEEIKDRYETKIKSLKEKEQKINEAKDKGSVEIAKEWSDYLLNKKKK